MKISLLTTIFNEKTFTPYYLSNLIDVVDQMVIVEGSWAGGSFNYGGNYRSTDGTREILEQFEKEHSDKVVLFDASGSDSDCLNIGLALCDHEWIFCPGVDEFYHPEELRKTFDAAQDYEAVVFPEYSFYFNFRRYMKTDGKIRLINMNGREFFICNGTGDNIRPFPKNILTAETYLYHYQWMGKREKVVKRTYDVQIPKEKEVYRSIGRDYESEKGTWKWWLEEVYLKYDGTEATEKELLERNRGSFHPWSYRDKGCRSAVLYEVDGSFRHPDAIKLAPFFDPDEKGIIDL